MSAKILLVEDDRNDLMIAMRAFERASIREHVQVARDGQEALEWLRLNGTDESAHPGAPRVVFLDLKMPRVDGWEVLRRMRASDRLRNVPVVVMSSSDRDEDIRESYRLGANSYLVKRFDPEEPGWYITNAARYWLELNQTAETGKEGEAWTS